MNIPLFQIDTFTDSVFKGNAAAVCPLEKWISDELMQKIATENNLSETAFFVNTGSAYEIRWFTPSTEVDLCGHATLAAGFVLFNYLGYTAEAIEFNSKSGILNVTRSDDFFTLDFPADLITEVELSEELIKPFTTKPQKAFKGITDYMLIFENEEIIAQMNPDFSELSKIDARGIIVTAKGDTADFVSRFFAPQSGINEDPVTGSAHTSLTPYWSKTLNKETLTAKQLSQRGGFLQCTKHGARIKISGQAAAYMRGTITI